MITSTGTAVGKFQGVIDEARVWNYARSLAEIQGAKNSELTSGAGLVARWGLNEGSGASVGDATATPAMPGTGAITGTGYSWVAGFVPPVVNGAPGNSNVEQPCRCGYGREHGSDVERQRLRS